MALILANYICKIIFWNTIKKLGTDIFLDDVKLILVAISGKSKTMCATKYIDLLSLLQFSLYLVMGGSQWEQIIQYPAFNAINDLFFRRNKLLSCNWVSFGIFSVQCFVSRHASNFLLLQLNFNTILRQLQV